MPAPQGGGGTAAPATAANPFLSATYPYSEVVNTQTYTPGASTTSSGTINITPGGYLRGLLVQVSSTGGSLGSIGSLQGDMPWVTLNSMTTPMVSNTNMTISNVMAALFIRSTFC